MLISFSGRPGSGKTTIMQMLLATNPSWEYPERVVTREPRPSDLDGKYIYLSEEEFMQQQANGELFLPVTIHGFVYGN